MNEINKQIMSAYRSTLTEAYKDDESYIEALKFIKTKFPEIWEELVPFIKDKAPKKLSTVMDSVDESCIYEGGYEEAKQDIIEGYGIDEEAPCWDGYEAIGNKMKDGKEVPNCVPIDEDEASVWPLSNLSPEKAKEMDEAIKQFYDGIVSEYQDGEEMLYYGDVRLISFNEEDSVGDVIAKLKELEETGRDGNK